MKQNMSGTRDFGYVTVYWMCNYRDASCAVKMWWRGGLIIERLLHRHESKLPFNVRPEGQSRNVVVGNFELQFDLSDMRELMLELNYPEGEMRRYALWSEIPQPIPPEPIPPCPIPPSPHPMQLPIAVAHIKTSMETDLFPYLYLRPWPGVTKEEKYDRFIEFDGDQSNTMAKGFYQQLLTWAKNGDRLGMENEAVCYIEAPTVYEAPDQFIEDIAQLPVPLNNFAACYTALREQPDMGYVRFRQDVEVLLMRSWEELRQEVNAPYFTAAVNRCWESVFALMILLGDQRRLLDSLIKTITLANLLSRMFLLQTEIEVLEVLEELEEQKEIEELENLTDLEESTELQIAEEIKEIKDDYPAPDGEHHFWTRCRIADGLAASLILPKELFPMPLAKATSNLPILALPESLTTPLTLSDESIVPYAIGDLELVRQRLAGYALGEVSRIENVMRGELIETTRRHLSRTSYSSNEHGESATSGTSMLTGTHADFLDEAHRTLALEFSLTRQTTYGPPTDATANELITVAPNKDNLPQSQNIEKAAKRAQEITTRTATQLARKAAWERASSNMQENEETVVNRIDGSNYESNQRGIYRWVDKIYTAHLVNYGHRLIIEFNLDRPAATLLDDEESLHGLSLLKPKSPKEFGIKLYTDISMRPEDPAYYANLIAYYGISEVALPPESQVIVNASFQAGQTPGWQEIAIPDGYAATSATISVNWSATTDITEIFGLIGTNAYQFQPGGDGTTQSTPIKTQTIPLQRECGTLSFSIAMTSKTGGKNDDVAAAVPPIFMANADITLEPVKANIEQWQFQLYNAIQAAYIRQKKIYFSENGAMDAGLSQKNSLIGQQAIRQTMRRKMNGMLWDGAIKLIGNAGLLPINRGRYHQFFEQAFEWNEMTFSLCADSGVDVNPAELSIDNSLLIAFLQARSARVLLPVHPDSRYVVPYFLASGMIWYGINELTPVNVESVDLVNELKSCHGAHDRREVRSQCWDIRVPTTMMVIQNGDELPVFE